MRGRRGKGLFQKSPAESSEEPGKGKAGRNLRDASTQTHEDSQVSKTAAEQCPKHGERNSAGHNFPAVQPTLCDKCSKSMLSYIALVQQFLDGVAQDVSQRVDPLTRCAECIRENLSASSLKRPSEETCVHADARQASPSKKQTAYHKKSGFSPSETDGPTGKSDETPRKSSGEPSKSDGTLGKSSWEPSKPESFKGRAQETPPSSRYEKSRRSSHERRGQTSDQSFNHRNVYHDDIASNTSLAGDRSETPPETQGNMPHLRNDTDAKHVSQATEDLHEHETEQEVGQPSRPVDFGSNSEVPRGTPSFEQTRTSTDYRHSESAEIGQNYSDSFNQTESLQSGENPVSNNSEPVHQANYNSVSQGRLQDSSPHIFHEDNVFDILSTRYHADPEHGDAYRESPYWENKSKTEDPAQSAAEAFVTLARNNTEALGCLVLGASLIVCGTRRTLCILVADGVSTDFMAPLSSVFNVVQKIRSLDSLGTTKLSLLDQPELGISFTKLNIWRLEQFTKCVYLNYDTLVVQNCDELFCYEELSAVPDIGWPDCFNSAVFVFRPSVDTFWQLLDFAEKQGSYDDGDQGLMNSYFHTWSQDIHKKLSFIYNLMANVSYTYTPAFRQFGRNVKIVQFIGTFKPWHVKFYSESGQIAPTSSVHPTYVQFIHVWLHVFRFRILSLLSQEIQNFTSSQNVVSAQELLRFFPSPNESELEFLLTPPSVRLRAFDCPQIGNPAAFIEKIRRSSSTPNLRSSSIPEAQQPDTTAEVGDASPKTEQVKPGDKLGGDRSAEETDGIKLDAVLNDETEEVEVGEISTDSMPAGAKGNAIPGSEVGNYQGMSAWEQGRMDYQGTASSDTIIKRLHFLMKQPDRLV